MKLKPMIAGGLVIAGLAGAGIAVAESTASAATTATPTAGASTSATSRPAKRPTGLAAALHAQWVTKGKNGTFVTHDQIRGTVTAVSATGITVKAADGVSQSYVVGANTKVFTRAKGASGPTVAAIGAVRTGATVAVAGTGSTTLTAGRVVERV